MKKTSRILLIVLLACFAALSAFAFVGCANKNHNKATQYTLTFISGDAEHAKITAEADEDIAAPTTPAAPSGKTFYGWSLQPGGAIVTLPTKMPAENRTYYAFFRNVYTVTLDVGDYGTVDTPAIANVTQGSNLYELIKDITPAAVPGADPVFAAWFYNGSEVTASSTVTVGANITVEARYKVGYTVKIFKSGSSSEYVEDTAAAKSGVDYVGKTVTQMPILGEGFTPDIDAAGSVTKLSLSAKASENVFKVYYKVLDYFIQFNANAPASSRPNGKMDNISILHGEQKEVPDCEYTVEKYRFAGWATSASGEIEYRVGDKFTATRGMTLYAVWDKGSSDGTGKSADLIFVRDGKAYLQREGLEEKVGEFNANTNTFKFGSKNTVLRGIIDLENSVFMYTGTSDSVVYSLFDRGTIKTDTLELGVEGNGATYRRSGSAVNGTYAYSAADRAFKFTPDGGSGAFCFRLSKYRNTTDVFEIRSDEYGKYYSEYYSYDENGDRKYSLDDSYYFVLDGYGNLQMYTRGLEERDEGYWDWVTNEFKGKYVITDAENNMARVTVYTDATSVASRVDEFVCRLDRDFYAATETAEAVHGYLKIGAPITLYQKDTDPVASSNTKITLDGSGESFSYYKGADTPAFTGSYEIDYDNSTLELYDTKQGKAIMIDLFEGDDGKTYYTERGVFVDRSFVLVDNLSYITQYGSYTVVMRVYEETDNFELKFIWLNYDDFYRVDYIELVTLVSGNLGELLGSGEQSGADGSVSPYDVYYVQNTTVSSYELAYALSILYSADIPDSEGGSQEVLLYGNAEYYNSFVLYLYDDFAIAGNTFDTYNKEITVEGKTLVLDGMFRATEKDNTDGTYMEYYIDDYGLPLLLLVSVDENGEVGDSVQYFEIDGEYCKVLGSYPPANASYPCAVYLLEGGKAVLMAYDGDGYIDGVVGWGEYAAETVEHEPTTEMGIDVRRVDHIGSCSVTHIVDAELYALLHEYSNFRFIATDNFMSYGFEDGTSLDYNDASITLVPAPAMDGVGDYTDNGIFVTATNGDVLIVDYDNVNASVCYYDGDKLMIRYDGSLYVQYGYGMSGFDMHGNALVIHNLESGDGLDDGNEVYRPVVIKLIYNADGALVDFVEVPDRYIGAYIDLDEEFGSYIVLDGIGKNETSASAAYYVLNANGEVTKTVEGTYAKASGGNANEFIFTPANDEDKAEHSFKFEALTLDDNTPIMIKAYEEVNREIYDVGTEEVIARLTRGEYDAYHYFAYGDDLYTGYLYEYDPFEDGEIYYVFEAVRVKHGEEAAEACDEIFTFGIFDGKYYLVDNNVGTYYYADDTDIQLVLNGAGAAAVIFADKTVFGEYVNMGKGEGVIFTEDGDEIIVLCGYVDGVGVFFIYDEAAYGFGRYESAGYESIDIDGYGRATYTDAYGISHEGYIEAKDDGYVFVSYIYNAVELELDIKLDEGSFVATVPQAA